MYSIFLNLTFFLHLEPPKIGITSTKKVSLFMINCTQVQICILVCSNPLSPTKSYDSKKDFYLSLSTVQVINQL